MSVYYTSKTQKNAHQPENVPFDALQLRDIPNVMKKMNWNVAASLMEKWFTSNYFAMKEGGPEIIGSKQYYMNLNAIELPRDRVDTTTIKMNWIRSFKRIELLMQYLQYYWNTKAGNMRLFTSILTLNQSHKVSKYIEVGNTDDIFNLEYYAQVNFKSFGRISDEIDELFGAIGSGNLKVCIRGYFSEYLDTFNLKGLGFYIKDSYDFSTHFEFLGVWTKDKVLNKVETASYMISLNSMELSTIWNEYQQAVVPVYNSDFRTWRDIHGMGGDFILFSDVHWIECNMIIRKGQYVNPDNILFENNGNNFQMW